MNEENITIGIGRSPLLDTLAALATVATRFMDIINKDRKYFRMPALMKGNDDNIMHINLIECHFDVFPIYLVNVPKDDTQYTIVDFMQNGIFQVYFKTTLQTCSCLDGQCRSCRAKEAQGYLL